jgi:hypothetical protein
MSFFTQKFCSKQFSSEVLTQTIDYIAQRANLHNIIFVGNIEKKYLENTPDGTRIYFIGDRKCLSDVHHKDVTILNYNINKGLPFVSPEILTDSVIIIDRVIDTLNGYKLLKDLSNKANEISSILITTVNREYDENGKLNTNEFKNLLNEFHFHKGFLGSIPTDLYSDEKKDLLYIGGCLNSFMSKITHTPKVCAIISTYNEEDVIQQVCEYLLGQNIHVHLIDNWSTDATPSVIRKLSNKYKEITFEVYPDVDSKDYLLYDILTHKIQYAKSNDYDWYIHYDADEIRESCFDNKSLTDSLGYIDSLGFNAIDHTVLDFRPINNNFDNNDQSFENTFKYFDFGRRPGHFAQIKAWKNIPDITYDLSTTAGHSIYFEGRKVYPYKFLLKHYPLRSTQHMKKKIFKDRLPRFKKGKKEKGWHTQYDKYIDNENEIKLWEKEDLYEFDESFNEEFILERLFGVNIEPES